MAIHRVAIIFDNKTRPETTGTYCRRALREFVQVEHYLPSEFFRVPRQGFDLYLNIDDGLDYESPSDFRPRAFWAIDTHLDFEACLTKARGFDFVFAAQCDGAERFRQHGISSATWLPLACDPEIHRKLELDKQYDICFVGNVVGDERAELLQLIQKHFRNSFVGQRYFEEMAQTYSASRIVFNRSVRNDINMRVFESLACGSLLLTNDLRENGQEQLFQAGVHLDVYHDGEELIDKIKYYLAHADASERIAAAGREEVLAKHTYRHRMEVLLRDAERQLSVVSGSSSVARNSAARSAVPQRSTLSVQPAATGPQPSTLAPQPTFRDHSYFEFARPELVSLIPASARRVLDIGCGAGRVGEAIKQRQQAHVTGIELDAEAATEARTRLDRVLQENIEQMSAPFGPSEFDAVICGDILEHLRDPLDLLRKVGEWLRPDGCIVASIPNVRHHSVVRGLLQGNWTYESAGLLDRDHVRFFTRREIEKLWFSAKHVDGVLVTATYWGSG